MIDAELQFQSCLEMTLIVGFSLPQVLVTKPDFYNEVTRTHLASTISELISLNIVPIINTNDAVSPPPQVDEDLTGVRKSPLQPKISSF